MEKPDDERRSQLSALKKFERERSYSLIDSVTNERPVGAESSSHDNGLDYPSHILELHPRLARADRLVESVAGHSDQFEVLLGHIGADGVCSGSCTEREWRQG